MQLTEKLLIELQRRLDIGYLLHQIKEEKSWFMPIINPLDFNRVLPVKVKLNNNRILKQDGAFLLFGIDGKKATPAKIQPFKSITIQYKGGRKKAIRTYLKNIGINESTLYPELDKQTQYIKDEYARELSYLKNVK